jgi:predicted metal-dependent peptidase
MLVKARLPAEKRIEVVHVSLMRDPKFALFAGLFMVGKTEISDNPHLTASTNGRDAKYGRAFVDSLTDKELAFLIMHENMHKCYRHLTTWRSLWEINAGVANISCDHVINLQLVDMDPEETCLAFPRDRETGERIGAYDPRFRGFDTKQVFDILLEETEDEEPQDGDEPCDNPTGGGQGDEAGGAGKEKTNRQGVGKLKPMDVHDWQDATDGMSKEEKKQLERDIEQVLRQGGIYAGKVGGNMPREIGELLKPKVNWREVLRRFVRTSLKDRDSASWRKAHKNFLWQDVILPSILGKRVKWLVLGMDTSGSIQGQLLTAFLSEMNACLASIGADRVDVIYWDAEVAGHETYKGNTKNIVHQTNPKGGGGTDPDVVVDFMEKERMTPDALIMLSDGHMHTNKPKWASIKAPTLWCIIGNDNYEVPNGQKLVIRD